MGPLLALREARYGEQVGSPIRNCAGDGPVLLGSSGLIRELAEDVDDKRELINKHERW